MPIRVAHEWANEPNSQNNDTIHTINKINRYGRRTSEVENVSTIHVYCMCSIFSRQCYSIFVFFTAICFNGNLYIMKIFF